MRVIVHETISAPIGMAVSDFIKGIGGVQAHEGGIVGEISSGRTISGLALATAPRLHSGLGPNEFAAVLERGERVIPKGGGAGNVNIYVSTPDAGATARWVYRNRKQIASALNGAQNENHTLRRSER